MADILVLIGLWSAAVGAVSGFAVTLMVEKPDALAKAGPASVTPVACSNCTSTGWSWASS